MMAIAVFSSKCRLVISAANQIKSTHNDGYQQQEEKQNLPVGLVEIEKLM